MTDVISIELVIVYFRIVESISKMFQPRQAESLEAEIVLRNLPLRATGRQCLEIDSSNLRI
jgi:hypothetical protein